MPSSMPNWARAGMARPEAVTTSMSSTVTIARPA
jgi:hypothetical protein